MDEMIIMKVRCPFCDKYLFDSVSTMMKYKCSCHKDLVINVEDGKLLIGQAEETDSEDHYNALVNRQTAYIAKVSVIKNKNKSKIE